MYLPPEAPPDGETGGPYPGKWTGKWIWLAGERHPFHRFLMVRRSMALTEAPSRAKLRVTVEDRCLLYVNGTYLGRGPARSDPRWKSYDVYDVGKFLVPGKNVIAVLAYHYGCQNCYSRDARAGLFAELELTDRAGVSTVIGSDRTWRVRPARGWNRDVELINSAVGVTEVYDANLDPTDWMQPDFDDSDWDPAWEIPVKGWGEQPWTYLERRQVPLLAEVPRRPVRVVQQGEVLEISRVVNAIPDIRPRTNDVPERLATEIFRPLEHARFEGAQGLPKGAPAIVESGRDQHRGAYSPYLIVDFGRPVVGFPKVTVTGPAGGIIEMTYGPELVHGRILPISQGVRYGDRYRMREGRQTWQVFEYKQFRYLLIVFRNVTEPMTLESLEVVEYRYPAERVGRFECAEPLLNRLWTACIDTTDLHMDDALICDAIRERRVWTGDGGHGLLGIWAAYGDAVISDWYFRLLSRGPTPDGMLRVWYPGTETELGVGAFPPEDQKKATVYEDPGTIPQHVLVFLYLAGEFHRHFGKPELLDEIYPSLAGALRWFGRREDEHGLLYNLPYWQWLDWVPTDFAGANFGTNAMYYGALSGMADIAEALGHARDAAVWRAKAAQVKEALASLFWNEDRGLYVDSVDSGHPSKAVTETANGLALLFGIGGDERLRAVARRLADPETDIVRASPLFFAYTLDGLFAVGEADVAMTEMRRRYERMMGYSDVPTIWESWTEVTASDFAQVHSGGVGPAWLLSRHVLGVYPVGPGFAACKIAPKTGSLPWARGAVPTVRGVVLVDWSQQDGIFRLDVRLPEGLTTEIVLPLADQRDLLLTHNGEMTRITAGASEASGIALSQGAVTVRVTGGEHRFEVRPA